MTRFAEMMQADLAGLIRTMGDGRQITLRRHDEIPDPKAAKTATLVAETVVADVLEGAFKEKEFNGQKRGDVKLMISGEAALSTRLDSSWTGQLDGDAFAYPIVIPTDSAAPDGVNVVGHVVALRKGAADAR